MTDLRGFRERMQVRGSRSVARGVPGGFGRRILRGSVCIQRGDALEIRWHCAVREGQGGLNGVARSGVLRVGVLEEVQDLLGTFRAAAGYSSQLIERELEGFGVNRHGNYSRPTQPEQLLLVKSVVRFHTEASLSVTTIRRPLGEWGALLAAPDRSSVLTCLAAPGIQPRGAPLTGQVIEAWPLRAVI